MQQLVRLHKGKLEVESELGKGTKFAVRLPDVEIKKSKTSGIKDHESIFYTACFTIK